VLDCVGYLREEGDEMPEGIERDALAAR